MIDLIAIGNISIDFYFQGETLTKTRDRFTLAIGGKYLTDYFYETLGGGGANVAIGVSRHGFKSAIIGAIGNNQFKDIIKKHLHDHSISDEFCVHKDNYMKISSILLSPSGERTIINYETPHEHIFESKEDLNHLTKTGLVYMSNLPRVPLEERIHVLSFLKQHDIKIALNFGIKDCRRPFHQILPLITKANYLILNAHEFCELTKHSYEAVDFKKDIRKYIHADYDMTLIITDGKKGSYGYVGDKVVHVKAVVPSKVVDTTGAGDGFTAGFLSGILKQKTVPEAMELGAQYASKIIEKVGAN